MATPRGGDAELADGAESAEDASPGEDLVGGADAELEARIRTALLDDHEILLDSMSSWILNNASEFDLVVSAGTWIDLVTSTAFPTQLVLMDFQLKEPISIEARIRTCRAAGAVVIVLTAVDDEASKARALGAGAAAFLSKSLPMRDVISAARLAMGRGQHETEVAHWRPLPVGTETISRPKLSAGELEALRLYVGGGTTGDVAAEMNVQYETVKTYLRRVREKYARAGRPASKRADLIRRAAEDGFLQ